MAADAGSIIESLFVALGFKVDASGIDEMRTKTEQLKSAALKVGALLSGAAIGLGLFTRGIAHSLGDIQDFAELNQMSARSVAALNKVAQENDSSTEGMQSTLQSLNGMVGQAALGIGRGAMLFKRLGLEARDASGRVKPLEVILEDVAGRMQSMSRQEQIAMGNKLGIDPMLVKLLAQGSDHLRQLREEAEALNPLTEEQYQLADEVDKLFIKAQGTFTGLTKQLGASLLPIVRNVLLAYLDWFKASKKAASEGLIKGLRIVSDTLGTIWDWLVRLVNVVRASYLWLSQFESVAWAVGTVLGVLIAYQVGSFFLTLGSMIARTTAALWSFNLAAALPAILFGAFIIAVALLVDELINFYEGNETLIGQLNEKYPGAIYLVWAALLALIGGFVAMKWAAISSMFETLAILAIYAYDWIAAHLSMAASTLAPYAPMLLIIAGIAAVVAAIWWLWSNWGTVTEFMGQAWSTLINFLNGSWLDSIHSMADVWDAVTARIGQAIDWVVGKFTAAKNFVMGFLDPISGLMTMAGKAMGLPEGTPALATAMAGNVGGLSLGEQATARVIGAPSSVIGGPSYTESSTAKTVTNSTQITVPSISIVSPDPEKAGEAVRMELERMQQQATRNGQSAVAL